MAQQPTSDHFHINSPLVESVRLSQLLGAPVYLKLDALQPSGSFKIRGLGIKCWKAVHERGVKLLVSSSGGNAGMAVAYSGRKLGVPVTVVVPESTPQMMREKIAAEGAKVVVHGAVWSEANDFAMKLANQEGAALIHPFDDPEIWTGHTTIVKEISQQLTTPPSAILCTVGGGGLMCGILEGLHSVGWQSVQLIAIETEGAAKLYPAVQKGELVTIPAITSIAKTLGASRLCEGAWEWTKKHTVHSRVVSDLETVKACYQFAEDHRILVEPSCGAGLAAVYESKLKDLELSEGLVIIVCGGSIVNFELLEGWLKQFNIRK
jgi:L-serine/L-threonine ammonia-lyase